MQKLIWGFLFMCVCVQCYAEMVTGSHAVTYCARLDPLTVCESTADCYNTSDCVVICDGTNVNLTGRCAATSGDADNSTTSHIKLSSTNANNFECWCAMTHPVASKWVLRYEYASYALCAQNCARGCRNAFIFDNEADISFRDTLYTNLVD